MRSYISTDPVVAMQLARARAQPAKGGESLPQRGEAATGALALPILNPRARVSTSMEHGGPARHADARNPPGSRPRGEGRAGRAPAAHQGSVVMEFWGMTNQ